MRKWTKYDDEIVFAVCEQFLEGKRAQQIADDVGKATKQPLTREQVYPLLAEARDRGFLRLCPPISRALEQRMRDHFRIHDKSIQVAEARGGGAGDHVADIAAKTAYEEIVRLASKKGDEGVHVGLGAGTTTMTIARFLGELLRANAHPGKITIHALGAGFSITSPETAPTSFFSFFHGLKNAEFVGVFATPYTPSRDYEKIKTYPGLREAFERKPEIDIVITAFAAREDPHGEFSRFMDSEDPLAGKLKKSLSRSDWVGDLQYRPYSAKGPITRNLGVKAVTLFEFDELVQFAAEPEKSVILAAGPCRVCTANKGPALVPLLEHPDLAAWSHLILDLDTASGCLDGTEARGPERAS